MIILNSIKLIKSSPRNFLPTYLAKMLALAFLVSLLTKITVFAKCFKTLQHKLSTD